MAEPSKNSLDVPRSKSRETRSRSNSRQSARSVSTARKSLSSRQRTGSRRSAANSDDDESVSEAFGEHGFPKNVDVQIHQFVYSEEVQSALDKLRERRARRHKFKKNEVHIFNLPKIVTSGTLPFIPSATFVRSMEEAKLPEPRALPSLPVIRHHRRQRTLLRDQTLENVEEEFRSSRRQTPFSRSFMAKTPRITPRSTPRTTPRASQRTTPKLTTPNLTPRETPSKTSR